MSLSYKKLSELADIPPENINETTKIVVTTGSVKSNNNLKVSDLVKDNLTTDNQYVALSAKMGKKLQDEKAPLNSPSFTGEPTAPTQLVADNSTKLATTAFVKTVASSKANIDSPRFINGISVSCPTGECFHIDGDEGDLILNNETGKAYSNSFLPLSDNSARIATTAFVKAVVGDTANLNGTNYLMVYGKGTPTENGAELLAAYNAAKKMPRYLGTINFGVVATVYKGQAYTIGGSNVTLLAKKDYTGFIQNQSISDKENIAPSIAKSIRTTVIVAPGEYDFGASAFIVDTDGINIVSLTGSTDVILSNLTVIVSSTFISGIEVVSTGFININSNAAPSFSMCKGYFSGGFGTLNGEFYRCNFTSLRCYEIAGKLIDCTGSFSVDTFGGIAINCRLYSGNFGTPTGGGRIYNSIDGNGNLINAPLPIFDDNAAAASLAVGAMYRTSTGVVMIKY